MWLKLIRGCGSSGQAGTHVRRRVTGCVKHLIMSQAEGEKQERVPENRRGPERQNKERFQCRLGLWKELPGTVYLRLAWAGWGSPGGSSSRASVH